jgi:hypothetical protein
MAAGTASISLDNQTGFFTPEADTPNPFPRIFRPGRRIRVIAIPDETTGDIVPLFTGRLDASTDQYTPGGDFLTQAVTAVDFMGDWQAFTPTASAATGVQATSDRVTAALDRYDWPAAERDIQTGSHTMLSADLSLSTLEECQRAADAEGSVFFCDRDGKATFKARDWLTSDVRPTTVQGYVGYDEVPAGALAAHIIATQTSWELARVANIAAFLRDGGTVQRVEDEGSKGAYRPRTYTQSGLQNSTDAQVLTLASRYLAAYKDLRMRIDSVTIAAVEGDGDANRLLWDTRFGDRLAVRIAAPFGHLERETHVTGFSHVITADDWLVSFRLDDAQAIAVTYWILEDPEFGVLGDTTRLSPP